MDLRDIRDRISDQLRADGLEPVLICEYENSYDEAIRSTVDRRRYSSYLTRGFGSELRTLPVMRERLV